MFEHQTSHRKCHSWNCHQAQHLITNKKLTLQLFRFRSQGLCNVLWECFRVTLRASQPALPSYLLLFTEADAPQSCQREAFGSPKGRMFQGDRAVAGQMWAWQSDRSGRVDGCHIEVCDLEQDTDPP